MRYILRVIICFILYTFLLSYVYAQEEPPVSLEEQKDGFEIVSLEGSVKVFLDDEQLWGYAADEMFLQANDKIETDKNSYVELALDEEGKNVIRLEPETSVVILLKEKEKIELFSGEIFSTINALPKESSFEIRTPTAVCGVRGTDWAVKVDNETTKVESVEGTPYIKWFTEKGKLSPEETILLAGYTVTIQKFHKPTVPIKLSQKRYSRLVSLKQELLDRSIKTISQRRRIPGCYSRLERMRRAQKRRLNIDKRPPALTSKEKEFTQIKRSKSSLRNKELLKKKTVSERRRRPKKRPVKKRPKRPPRRFMRR